jgi:hypothetical protein
MNRFTNARVRDFRTLVMVMVKHGPLLDASQMGNLKKRPPIGMEGVYDENSDYRGKKTNRMEKNIKYID